MAAFLVLGGLSGCATTDGTLSGDLLGPLEGGFLGDYSYRKEKGLEETRQIHSEPPATTDANVRIEAIRAVPDILDPGDTIDIRIKYAVLTPQEDMTVIVNETREILFEENRVGEASANIEREGGTWRSSVPITLPQNASPGIYRIVVSIRTPNGEKDVEEVTFRVR
ncbi:MAG: hypothetical protein FWH25_03435 [Syntrophorhabdaceae bacterium]|nr:hypothetical protein [Syntrophorhabdaceae bacterium]